MSLLCLVIVGKDNEPLYQRDFGPRENDDPAAVVSDDEADCFGFASTMRSTETTISLRHEFMMHSALDYLDEATSAENRAKSRAGNTKWIGKLCPMEETLIYAYVTATNVKMMAMVEDSPNPAHAARESDLKIFFTRLHEMFVQYTLNPFTKLRELIISKRFDDGVAEAVSVYNENHEVGA
jgi:hypothetical protein